MIAWLAANAATIIVGVILFAAVFAAIRHILKKTKNGRCAGCAYSCGKTFCPGSTVSYTIKQGLLPWSDDAPVI